VVNDPQRTSIRDASQAVDALKIVSDTSAFNSG
jgi:hypothetical protein